MILQALRVIGYECVTKKIEVTRVKSGDMQNNTYVSTSERLAKAYSIHL